MELLEVLITLPSQTVTVPAGATTELVYQQLLILLQNPMTTLPLERLRLLEQSMIMMRLQL
jgi:hypothetical protein